MDFKEIIKRDDEIIVRAIVDSWYSWYIQPFPERLGLTEQVLNAYPLYKIKEVYFQKNNPEVYGALYDFQLNLKTADELEAERISHFVGTLSMIDL